LHVSAVIVAAGLGQRFGGSTPKQFLSIAGKPILYYTLQIFEQCVAIEEVVVVAAEEWLSHISHAVVDRFGLTKVKKVVAGGNHRQDSVYAGLKALDGPPELVAVHDAVRPFVSAAKVDEVVSACLEHGAAILAVPPKDTIKIEKDGFVEKTPFRDKLWSVQTPQVFRYDIILEAYAKAYECGVYQTDDSALVERVGYPIKIVEGEELNFKITVPLDLSLAEMILSAR
jgi:2-C-methyl-D-erythritol 4-phosphate cytidylyltransferase